MHLDIASDGVSQIMAQFGRVVKANEIGVCAPRVLGCFVGVR
jgi:hypothetical protein